MKRNVNQNRMIRVLAASLWLAGIAVYPLQGEAAIPGKGYPGDKHR